MPTLPSTSLETQSPSAISVTPEPSNYSSIAETVGSVVELAVGAKKRSILGELAAESQNIVSATSLYKQAKDDIVSKMVKADQSTFNNLAGDLEAIRRGEVQGVLSPQAANVKLQSLAKQYINRYPRMAADIRKLLGAISGDITPDTKTGDIADPVLKAQYALVEEATSRGTTVEDLLKQRDAADARSLAENKLGAAVAQGSMDSPQLMYDFIQSGLVEATSLVTSGMLSRMKAGTFVKENEIAAINAAKQQGLVALRQRLLEYQVESGKRLDLKVFEDEYNRNFDNYLAIANVADSTDQQKRLTEASEALLRFKDYKYYHDALGALGPIAMSNPEQAFKILGELTKTLKLVQDGHFASLEQARKLNPEVDLYMSLLTRDGNIAGRLMEQANRLLKGEAAKPLGPEGINHLYSKIALDVGTAPGTPEDEAAHSITNFISSPDGAPIEAIVAHKPAQKILAQSGEAQKAFERRVSQHLVSFVANTPLHILRSIQIDPANGTKPFKLDTTVPVAGSVGNYGLTPQFTTVTTKQAKKFNDYLYLMQLYKKPEEASEQVIGQFKELLAKRVEQEMLSMQELMNRVDPHASGRDGAPTAEDEQITQVDKAGNVHFEYDRQQELVIDKKHNKILPDNYDYNPQELEDLKRDIPELFQPAE